MASSAPSTAAPASVTTPAPSAAVPPTNCFSPSAPKSFELQVNGRLIEDTIEARRKGDQAAWDLNVESYHNQGYPKSEYWQQQSQQREEKRQEAEKRRAAEAAGEEFQKPKKKRPKHEKHPLWERWIEHGGCELTPHVQITVQLRNANLERPHGAGDGFEAFEVLCWQDHGGQAVLGATIGSETQLRLVPSSSLRRATLEALRKIQKQGAGTHNAKGERHRYTTDSFAGGASFLRPGGREQPVLIIKDGPLQHMACNATMQKYLMEQVSWTREHAGGSNYSYIFTVAAANLQEQPQLPDAAGQVAQVVRYNFRGEATLATFEEAAAVMRDSASQLPHWPTGAVLGGKPKLLTTLQTMFDSRQPPAPVASRGRALTFKALGAEATTRTAASTRRASQEAEPSAFVLGNCETDARGNPTAGKLWTKDSRCRCGLRLSGESANRVLSKKQLRPGAQCAKPK